QVVYASEAACQVPGVNQAMQATMNNLRTMNGATTFSISGNYANLGSTTSPGCLPAAVMVGAVYDSSFGSYSFGGTCTDATTASAKVTCLSNVNATVDLLAPGCQIVSDYPLSLGGPLSWFCGTSQACPHAVGTAALLLERNPSLTPTALIATLTSTGTPVLDT